MHNLATLSRYHSYMVQPWCHLSSLKLSDTLPQTITFVQHHNMFLKEALLGLLSPCPFLYTSHKEKVHRSHNNNNIIMCLFNVK